MSYGSLRKLGIQAAAAPAGVAMPMQAAVGDASWFHTPSIRKARIDEVDGRITQFGRELDLAENAQGVTGAPQLLTQWLQFRKNWEDWIAGLSTGALFLPSTEEWVDRQEEQLERFRTAFAQEAGVKMTAAPGMGAAGPVSPPGSTSQGINFALLAFGALALVGATLYFARPVVVKASAAPPFKLPDFKSPFAKGGT